MQSGQQTIADYTAGAVPGSPTYTYVYASYIDEPVMRGGSGGLRYYHRNQQYSVIALTSGGGAVVERYAYTAYGTPTILDSSLSPLATSNSSNRYTYTGREYDEALALYHYRARMYDPSAGRFCGRDPIGFEANDPSTYRIAFGRILIGLDPTGMKCAIHLIIGHAGFLDGVLGENKGFPTLPEADECDRFAPVCCFSQQHVELCKTVRPGLVLPGVPQVPKDKFLWCDDAVDDKRFKPGDRLVSQVIAELEKAIDEESQKICDDNKCGKCKAVFVNTICDYKNKDMRNCLRRLKDKGVIEVDYCRKNKHQVRRCE